MCLCFPELFFRDFCRGLGFLALPGGFQSS